jgi:hypothetical protein
MSFLSKALTLDRCWIFLSIGIERSYLAASGGK